MTPSEAGPSPDAAAELAAPDVTLVPVQASMEQLLDDAAKFAAAQQRLQRLLAANQSIVSELSLPAVLRRIVEAARDTAGAATRRSA